MALTQIAWEPTEDSSNVHDIFHHARQDILCVRFNSGAMYTYMGADHEMFMNLKHAQSVGKYLNQVIKALPYTRWESEGEMLAYLNIGGDTTVTCIHCNEQFPDKGTGCVVCDDCWADDPT